MTPTASPQMVRPLAWVLACLASASLVPALPAQEVHPAPAPAVPAPPPRRLTLEEAQQLALENNKSLVLARLNVEEKQHVADAARKDYFPKLLGNVTYFH